MSTPPQRTHSIHRKRVSGASHLPAIVVQDLSLALDYTPAADLSGVTEPGSTPFSRHSRFYREDSPRHWPDENTLISTPRSLLKSDEGKWLSGSPSLYGSPTTLASKTSSSKLRRFSEASFTDPSFLPDDHSATVSSSADVTSAEHEEYVSYGEPTEPVPDISEGLPVKLDTCTCLSSISPIEPRNSLPERSLRRSVRRTDLRSAYRNGPELFRHDATRRQAVTSDDGAGSFEYELTLALLREMDRAIPSTGGWTTHPRCGVKMQSGAGGKSLLRNLGTLMNAFGSHHRTTGVAQISS
ncbi:hypothetical protein EIP86_000940 [Pleurotus ostreatoroseus]|nr:hypothetical protein EIP86_000940 [Pleurotus ostreatoroseus]